MYFLHIKNIRGGGGVLPKELLRWQKQNLTADLVQRLYRKNIQQMLGRHTITGHDYFSFVALTILINNQVTFFFLNVHKCHKMFLK